MPKSLGQIHTVRFNYEQAATATGSGTAHLCDVAGKLTGQFNRQCRHMANYKIVGFDIVAQLPEDVPTFDSDRVMCKGRLRFFQPTKGRCDAMRTAYKQMRQQMKDQGVDPSDNLGYDFRVLPRSESNYASNLVFDTVALRNNSTLDGVTPLAMIDNGGTDFEIFASHNANVQPVINTTNPYANGLRTQVGRLQAASGITPSDFVLNDGEISEGNPNFADVVMEEIPFELAYDSTARRVTQFNWRPDPALYLSVLTGQVEVVLDEISALGASGGLENDAIEIDISIHVAGWKSIVHLPRTSFGKRSRSAKRMRAAGSMLTQKNVKDLLGILAMAKKLK